MVDRTVSIQVLNIYTFSVQVKQINILKNIFNLGQVKERAIPVNELIEADEVFCTGTAVGVAPVGSITYQHKR